MLALLFLLATQQAWADAKGCYIDLTGQPYCITRANADRYCDREGKSDQALMEAKRCMLKNQKQYHGITPKLQTLCLGGYIHTGDPLKDSSNCTSKGGVGPSHTSGAPPASK